MVKLPEKLKDIIGQDLAGWKLGYVYFLEINHGLMGYFPVITVEAEKDKKGEIVAVAEKRLLRKVAEKVEEKNAVISRRRAVVNATLGIAFNLEGSNGFDAEALRLFSEAQIGVTPMEWAPGIIRLGRGYANSRKLDFDGPDRE